MGLIDRITGLFGAERRSAVDPSWAALTPGLGLVGAASARQAENLSAVLGCVTAIASAMAAMPALVYRRDSGGNRVEMPAHPLARMVRAGVSPQMGWPDFVEHLIASALLTGNGLAEIERDGGGAVTGLRFIPWGRVGVVQLPNGRLRYDVTEPRSGRVRRFLEGEVIHLRDRTDDGLIGRSRLSRAAETVAGVSSSNTFARSFLDRGAQPSGVIEYPGHVSTDVLEHLRREFDRRHSGPQNSGRPLSLPLNSRTVPHWLIG